MPSLPTMHKEDRDLKKVGLSLPVEGVETDERDIEDGVDEIIGSKIGFNLCSSRRRAKPTRHFTDYYTGDINYAMASLKCSGLVKP